MQTATLKDPFTPERLIEVAEEFGTPTYVYSEEIVRRKCAQLREHLAGIPLKLLYALKANFNPAVLAVVLDEELGLDAVSPGEIELSLRLGTHPLDILYSANNMTDGEMHYAQSRGVLLNIGDISRLEKYGRAYPGSEVCVRLNPQVGAGHHEHVITAGEKSKFGIPVDRAGEIRDVAERFGLRIIGLHQHIGSGILDTRQFWLAISVLLDASRAFENLRFLNFGGGLGIPYAPTDHAIDLENFQNLVVRPLQEFSKEQNGEITFWFEPGRFIVAECGVLLTRVNTLKETRTRTFAGTDSGFNHLARPTLYGAHHGIVNISNPEGPPKVYDVAGNICESGDLFARERAITEIGEDDVLAIIDAGAYGMAMASEYNLRPLPSEVFIDASGQFHLTRERITSTELVERLLQGTSVPASERPRIRAAVPADWQDEPAAARPPSERDNER